LDTVEPEIRTGCTLATGVILPELVAVLER
jgi:hypothetical protein